MLVPQRMEPQVLELERRAIATSLRCRKSAPGDRTEQNRFEGIHALLDQLAVAAMMNGEPTVSTPTTQMDRPGLTLLRRGQDSGDMIPGEVAAWLAEDRLALELVLPHSAGETPVIGRPGEGPLPPAEPWQTSLQDVRAATRERFNFLLSQALENSQTSSSAIRPSDVTNAVLTECLRRHVEKTPESPRCDLRVTYRDGSEGPRFPLRALDMSLIKPTDWRVLRFTLLSIRHVEMDALVDGAWLRNSKVSRPRPAGITDEIVFDISRRQLSRLTLAAPTLIYLYQTGLEPAVMGFYRAVVSHLLQSSSSLAVVPCFYQGDGEFEEGTLWRAK